MTTNEIDAAILWLEEEITAGGFQHRNFGIVVQAARRARALEAALQQYGRHRAECATRAFPGWKNPGAVQGPCNCGLGQVLNNE